MGIPLKFQKHYQRATEGRVKLYLDERMIDLKKPVTLIINGHERFTGKLQTERTQHGERLFGILRSERIYPQCWIYTYKSITLHPFKQNDDNHDSI